MQTFFKKIQLDDTLTEFFLSFLLKARYQVPPFSLEQQKLISHISEQFLISGFILESCSFDLSHKRLVGEIKHQRKIQLLKQMSVKNDLNNIAHSLNEKGIKHVFLKGSALNSDGIYSSGMRAARDIDLLVCVDMLHEAYVVLKSLGFSYSNHKTQDSVRYHRFGNHFSPMINESDTKLELHWRVTTCSEFKKCPLTENIFANRRVSKSHPHIYCPKIETTVAHLIHHSFKHHRINLGPISVSDLAAIFNFFNKNWPIDNELHKKLGVEKDFELCKKLIERSRYESSFSSTSKLLINQIFKHSQWLQLSDESKSGSPVVKTTRVNIFDNRNFISKILYQVRYARTRYQLSYYSAKFWLFLTSDFLMFFKKVMRRYSS